MGKAEYLETKGCPQRFFVASIDCARMFNETVVRKLYKTVC